MTISVRNISVYKRCCVPPDHSENILTKKRYRTPRSVRNVLNQNVSLSYPYQSNTFLAEKKCWVPLTASKKKMAKKVVPSVPASVRNIFDEKRGGAPLPSQKHSDQKEVLHARQSETFRPNKRYRVPLSFSNILAKKGYCTPVSRKRFGQKEVLYPYQS